MSNDSRYKGGPTRGRGRRYRKYHMLISLLYPESSSVWRQGRSVVIKYAQYVEENNLKHSTFIKYIGDLLKEGYLKSATQQPKVWYVTLNLPKGIPNE